MGYFEGQLVIEGKASVDGDIVTVDINESPEFYGVYVMQWYEPGKVFVHEWLGDFKHLNDALIFKQRVAKRMGRTA